jgi:hypothetical protein
MMRMHLGQVLEAADVHDLGGEVLGKDRIPVVREHERPWKS